MGDYLNTKKENDPELVKEIEDADVVISMFGGIPYIEKKKKGVKVVLIDYDTRSLSIDKDEIEGADNLSEDEILEKVYKPYNSYLVKEHIYEKGADVDNIKK